MTETLPIVSVALPVWNEAENLPVLYERLQAACRRASVQYELVFVDNGSTDASLAIIKQLCRQDPQVRYLSLSRNFGHQNALFAGMTACTGDAVVTMDADLQHPPELIPEMVRLWREGAEVVFTTKRDAKLPPIKRQVVKIFYKLISKFSGLDLDFGLSDFRLLDRQVADSIVRIPEYHKFLRGQVKWVGFKQSGLTYDVQARYRGQSKFSYANLFSFALDGLFAFSRYPLRVVALGGLLITGACALFMFYVCGLYALNFFHAAPPSFRLPPGWATLAVAVMFLGSTQLIALGILGEYLGRVYDQTKGRPNFIVRETSARDDDADNRDSLRRPRRAFAAADR